MFQTTNRILPALSAAAVVCLLSGCSEYRGRLDRWAFESLGGTLFSSPKQVTMKEIHLDHGKLRGREVIVEGAVVTFGERGTHVVVADDTARLLVVTTNLANRPERLKEVNPKRFRVLGTVE